MRKTHRLSDQVSAFTVLQSAAIEQPGAVSQGVVGIDCTALDSTAQSDRADADMLGSLGVKGDVTGASIGKIRNDAIHRLDHQVHVDRRLDAVLAQRLADQRTDRQVGHVVIVHDIKMDDVGAGGEDVVDFGMGNPGQPPPGHITQKLIETLNDPRVHRYSTSCGIPGLRCAISAYYDRRFGGEVDPEREAVVAFSKALLREAQVAVAPGIGFGEFGEGFVRFGLVENEQRIRQAVRNIRRFLNSPTHKKSVKAARVE